MDSDLDLKADEDFQLTTNLFFINEVVVGVMTVGQLIVAFCLMQMKSRHLREIEGEVAVSDKRVQFYANEIKQSREKSLAKH